MEPEIMLIDTSGFFSIHDKAAKQHGHAREIYQNARFRLTTNYVLAEYVALALIRGLSRERVLTFSGEALNDKAIEIVWVDETMHSSAVELLQKRKDKSYSLCDAVSFVIMRERNILEALSTDRDFEQEGFVRLLES